MDTNLGTLKVRQCKMRNTIYDHLINCFAHNSRMWIIYYSVIIKVLITAAISYTADTVVITDFYLVTLKFRELIYIRSSTKQKWKVLHICIDK